MRTKHRSRFGPRVAHPCEVCGKEGEGVVEHRYAQGRARFWLCSDPIATYVKRGDEVSKKRARAW